MSTDRVKGLRRRQMFRLARMRYGNPPRLPDDERGRNLIIAMFAVGIIAPDMLASWVTKQEIEELKDEAERRAPWYGADLGALVELKDAERQAGRLWHMDPIDMSRDEIKERNDRLENERSKKRKKLLREVRRAARELAADLDVRGEALLALITNEWTSISELLKLTSKCRAWQRPNGKRLSRRSHLMALRRTLDALAAAGLIDLKLDCGYNDQNMRFARRVPCPDARLLSATGSRVTDTARPDSANPCTAEASDAQVHVRSSDQKHVRPYTPSTTVSAATDPTPSPASDAGEHGPAKRTADQVTRVQRWSPSQISIMPGTAQGAGCAATPVTVLPISS